MYRDYGFYSVLSYFGMLDIKYLGGMRTVSYGMRPPGKGSI